MSKPVKTFIKVKGTDFKYEASGEDTTYEQMVKHYLSVLNPKFLIAELEKQGYTIIKKE